MKKITKVSELKAGDTIKILKKPSQWSSHFINLSSLDCNFPKTITIKELKDMGGYTSMTCGEYGWDLGSVIQAGCELIVPNESVSPLEEWLEYTKSLELSLEELEIRINAPSTTTLDIYQQLQGDYHIDKAKILYDEWNAKVDIPKGYDFKPFISDKPELKNDTPESVNLYNINLSKLSIKTKKKSKILSIN